MEKSAYTAPSKQISPLPSLLSPVEMTFLRPVSNPMRKSWLSNVQFVKVQLGYRQQYFEC